MKEWIDEHEISVPKPVKLLPISCGGEGGRAVQIQDLKPILGYPYLFQHANDCEHLIVFLDLRVINLEDPQRAQDYPLLSNKPNPRRIICKGKIFDKISKKIFISNLIFYRNYL